jgi:UDP-N-acetylmuramoyl-tripeptide--D-alanyl-D-alanine ligase
MRERADFRASGVVSRATEDGFVTEFDLDSPAGQGRMTIGLAGEHNVMNALAAAAASHAAGADLAAIHAGLAAVRPVTGRLETKRAAGGARLIDDSYNANPGSMRAGIRSLVTLPGQHWLVLGAMAELGEESPQLHAEIGEFARENGIERLFAVGADARHAVEAFGPGATWFENVADLVEEARRGLAPGVTVLVKGSRVNRLEQVVAALADAGKSATAAGEH